MKQGWELKKLGEVCEMYQPKTISTKEMVDDGQYSVFGANGIIGKYDKYNHEEPQLLITCRGATCGSVNISEPKSWINGNAMVVRPKDHSIDLKFLEYLFRGGVDLSKTITGAAQPQITRQSLIPIEISFPKSLPEQQRIVSILDKAFAAIDKAKANAEQNLKNARELFEGYLQRVFEEKGEGWEETFLANEIDLLTGFPFKSKDYTDEESDILLLRGDNIMQGELRWEDAKRWRKSEYDYFKKYQLQENDIVLAMDRPWVKAGLKCARLSKVDLPALLVQRTACLRAKSKIDSSFLYYLVKSKSFTKHLISVQTGIGVPHISGQQILDFNFNKPSIGQQQLIVQKLDSLSAETKKLEAIYRQKINDLEELKKTLLEMAFSGRLHFDSSDLSD